MTYITMNDKAIFLREVHQAMKEICHGLKHNLQPTAMNVHYDDKLKMNLSDDNHYSTALEKLSEAEEVERNRENDGNKHKLGQFIRKKANILYEAADNMSQIKEYFQAQFETKPLRCTLMNERGIKNMKMIAIRETIDEIIFSDDVKKLKPYKKHDKRNTRKPA